MRNVEPGDELLFTFGSSFIFAFAPGAPRA